MLNKISVIHLYLVLKVGVGCCVAMQLLYYYYIMLLYYYHHCWTRLSTGLSFIVFIVFASLALRVLPEQERGSVASQENIFEGTGSESLLRLISLKHIRRHRQGIALSVDFSTFATLTAREEFCWPQRRIRGVGRTCCCFSTFFFL